MKENSFKTVAIVLARGGSKGIPSKNIMPFCGIPLLVWTLGQLRVVKSVELLHSIWVSSDSPEIQKMALDCEVNMIQRPAGLSGDEATSESGWLHALNYIEFEIGAVDAVLGVQVTSPIRSSMDFYQALQQFRYGGFDSLFSACPARDLCLWERKGPALECQSYDRANPNRRRQVTFGERWIENGSFYLFTPEVLRQTGTRFGDRIGVYPMAPFKGLEIDEPQDVPLAEVVMQAFLEGKLK